MHILVISGGYSNERDVSLRSGEAVEKALRSKGHEVRTADPKTDLDWPVVAKDIDVAFNALHGAGGEDGVIQAQLEKIGLAYTGSGIGASDLCWDKWAYKEFLEDKDIPLSRGEVVTGTNLDSGYFKRPFVLKPIRGGSTLDTLIAREPSPQKLEEARKLLQKYDHMLIETLVEGVEITVGVFEDMALPVIEIMPPDGLEFDYENKYNGATKELCPPVHVSEQVQKQAQELALRIHRLTGCRHISRTDMIVDKNDQLHVLETNTVPGLTDQSLLPKMVKQAGMSFEDFVDKLVNLAIKK